MVELSLLDMEEHIVKFSYLYLIVNFFSLKGTNRTTRDGQFREVLIPIIPPEVCE